MEFAIFRCCPTSIFLKQYESSTDAVLRKLGVEFVNIREFNCCGYPLKNLNFKAFVLSSARNLSLAALKRVNILTFCNCCYGSLKHAQRLIEEDRRLKDEIRSALEKEALDYDGDVKVRHVLEVLYKDIGLDVIKEKIVRPFRRDLKVATHYGCHILRPSQILQFDSAMVPSIFDHLVEITGAESIDWSTKLECCGSPVWGTYDELSMALTEKKIVDARDHGADYLCVACVYCQIQFDRVQEMLLTERHSNHGLPSILYTQLLGLTMGIDQKRLGLDQNRLDLSGIMKFLS